MQWFRMYSEFASDPKVQSMSETLQRRFTMFLCLHCNGEYEQLDDVELAFALRITPEELAETRDAFKAKGFLDSEGKIRNWNKRQYKSDNVAERVRKHREQKGKRARNVTVTPSESDTDSDTDKKKTKSLLAASPPTRRKVSHETSDEEFLELKLAYPERSGDYRWKQARGATNARIAEGHAFEEIMAGARRYAEFCRAAGKFGTEYVMQASRFCGPEKPFLLPWHPPPKPENASAQILRKLNGTDDSRVFDQDPETDHEPIALPSH